MNCAEFEQAIAADPGSTPEGAAAHLAECAACRAVHDEYRELDGRIAKALRVRVPQLAIPRLDELDDDKVVTLQPRRRFTAPIGFGIAATIALAAWLGLALQQPDLSQQSLAEQVVAHLDHETYSRVISQVAVPERTLHSVVSKEVAELDQGMGLITYARSCVVNGKAIPHLVIQGKFGPITLLLMPDEPLAKAVPLSGNAISGVILPAGRGSIAIVAEREEWLDANEQQKIINSIKWKT